MNLLLFLPGLLFLLFTTLGAVSTVVHLLTIVLVQVLLAAPFLTDLSASPIYFHTAFNFSREFLWEWTVNWRWLGERAFESKELSGGLLIAHVVVLILCGLNWSEKEGGALKLLSRGLKNPSVGPARGQPHADCEFGDATDGTTELTLSTLRHLHRSLHLEPGRPRLRKITALPILRLVCPPSHLPPVAHALRHSAAVHSALSLPARSSH